MPEYVETVEDYNLKYTGCIVSYNGIPFNVNEFNNSDKGLKIRGCLLKKNKWGDRGTYSINDPELDLSCFSRSVINLGSSVIVFNLKRSINGIEKYKRAIHPGNTEVYDPFKKERKYLHSQPVKFNDPLIFKSWIKNSYYSAEKALETVSSYERIASAFSKEYYFGIKFCTNSIMLFRRNYMIGRVDPANNVVLLKPVAHPYSEELEEMGLTIKKVAK